MGKPTWTIEEVEAQERNLEARVAVAKKELDEVRRWCTAERLKLRKFRKAKITKAAQIVRAPLMRQGEHL